MSPAARPTSVPDFVALYICVCQCSYIRSVRLQISLACGSPKTHMAGILSARSPGSLHSPDWLFVGHIFAGFEAIDRICRQRQCQARGSTGEHTAVVDRIDVSNWRRIGVPEWSLVEDMISCANYLAELEDSTGACLALHRCDRTTIQSELECAA